MTPAAALAFLLSAPAINPIVLTATAVAFPNNPRMVLARFVASGRDAGGTQQAAERLAAWLRRANSERLGEVLTVLGPAPCPIERLKGRWRWHVLVKSTEARAIGRVVRAWSARARRAVVVDRDPVSLL